MAIVTDHPHTQYLTEKGFGIGAIRHGDGQVVKTKICPCSSPFFRCRLIEPPGLNLESVCVEVCDGLADEHIRENLIPIGGADTDAMANQQPCWQCMFQGLVKNLFG